MPAKAHTAEETKLSPNAVHVNAENPLPVYADTPIVFPASLINAAASFCTTVAITVAMKRHVLAVYRNISKRLLRLIK
jgi:hypothetical protein